ncbi:NLRC5 [Branchiostoma lanceolatum]|uniref:NLRC5 protein n=1 Tax=Branchiostoma lanceolatum TaxID=7740 RepID=A0A8J9ZLT1_BRALA|nr:NLRC5 [Branchiostoma lanceolatum]
MALSKPYSSDPVYTPGTDPVYTPGTDPVYTPGTDPVYTPGTDPVYTPGTDPVYTPGTARGAKLAALLVDEGTPLVRKIFEEEVKNMTPPSLREQLKKHKRYLYHGQLFKKQGKNHRVNLNRGQKDTLYPPDGGVIPDTAQGFDISLLELLLKELVWLELGRDAPYSGERDKLRQFRNNNYGHISSTDLSEGDFDRLWKELTEILVALGGDRGKISERLNSSIDPEQEVKYFTLLEKLYKEDMEVKGLLLAQGESLRKGQEEVLDQGHSLLKGQETLLDQGVDVKMGQDRLLARAESLKKGQETLFTQGESQIKGQEKLLDHLKSLSLAQVRDTQSLVADSGQREDSSPRTGIADLADDVIACLKDLYATEYAHVRPLPWCEDLNLHLGEVYTSLQLQRRDDKGHFQDKDIVSLADIYTTREGDNSQVEAAVRKIRVEGDPGIGKSCSCQKLAYDWSCGKLDVFKVVFFLEMRHLAGKVRDEIFEQLLPKDTKTTPDQLWSYIQENQDDVLFILDGLDELSQTAREVTDVVDLIQGKILRNCHVLVTSRPYHCIEDLEKCHQLCKIRAIPVEGDKLPPNIEEALRSLGKLSWEGLEQEQLQFNIDEINNKYGTNADNILNMGLLTRDYSFSRIRRTCYCAFLHKTFQEYMAAHHISGLVMDGSSREEGMKCVRRLFAIRENRTLESLVVEGMLAHSYRKARMITKLIGNKPSNYKELSITLLTPMALSKPSSTDPVYTPGTDPVYTPGTDPVYTPGTDPVYTPGTDPVYTPGTARGAKLAALLVDEGNARLREIFEEEVMKMTPPSAPTSLRELLKKHKTHLCGLRYLNSGQRKTLYPKGGDIPDTAQGFDISLLGLLLNELCPKAPKSGERDELRQFRNKYYGHNPSTDLDEDVFDDLWEELSDILVKLDVPKDRISQRYYSSIDPEQEAEYFDLLERLYMEEMEVKHFLDNLRVGQDSLKEGQAGLKEGQAGLKEGQGSLKEGQGSLKEGQAGLKEGQVGLKEGQACLKEGQDSLREGQGSLKEGQAGLREGQDSIKEGQGSLREGQAGLREGQAGLKEGQDRILEHLRRNQSPGTSTQPCAESSCQTDQVHTDATVPVMQQSDTMSEAHRTLLLRNYLALSQDVDSSRVLDCLHQQQVITDGMRRDILAIPEDQRHRRTRKLLDWILHSSDSAFRIFCSALEQAGYRHLSQLMEGQQQQFIHSLSATLSELLITEEMRGLEGGDQLVVKTLVLEQDYRAWRDFFSKDALPERSDVIQHAIAKLTTDPSTIPLQSVTASSSSTTLLTTDTANTAKTLTVQAKADSATGPSDQLHDVIACLKDLYATEFAHVRPLPWCENLNLHLGKVHTNLRLQQRDDGGRFQDTGTVVSLADIYNTRAGEVNVTATRSAVRKIRVEGDPGIGKSCSCQMLAYDWSCGKLDRFKFVFFLEMRHLAGKVKDEIFEQLLPEDTKTTPDQLWSYIKENQDDILFILDGLDELSQTARKVTDVVKLIQGKILRNCHVLVTSRPYHCVKDLKKCHQFYKIVGYSKENSEEFIHKYFCKSPESASRLVEQLHSNSNLSEMVANPLNNVLICVVWEDNNQKLPSSKAELYRDIVHSVAKRFCIKRDFPMEGDTLPQNIEEALRGLGKLSWEGLEQEQLQFNIDDIKKKYYTDAENMLNMGLLTRDYSFSRIRRTCYCAFLHKTFQEYMAARYISGLVMDENAREEGMKCVCCLFGMSDATVVNWELIISCYRKYREVQNWLLLILGENSRPLLERFVEENVQSHDDDELRSFFCLMWLGTTGAGSEMADIVAPYISYVSNDLDIEDLDTCSDDHANWCVGLAHVLTFQKNQGANIIQQFTIHFLDVEHVDQEKLDMLENALSDYDTMQSVTFDIGDIDVRTFRFSSLHAFIPGVGIESLSLCSEHSGTSHMSLLCILEELSKVSMIEQVAIDVMLDTSYMDNCEDGDGDRHLCDWLLARMIKSHSVLRSISIKLHLEIYSCEHNDLEIRWLSYLTETLQSISEHTKLEDVVFELDDNYSSERTDFVSPAGRHKNKEKFDVEPMVHKLTECIKKNKVLKTLRLTWLIYGDSDCTYQINRGDCSNESLSKLCSAIRENRTLETLVVKGMLSRSKRRRKMISELMSNVPSNYRQLSITLSDK